MSHDFQRYVLTCLQHIQLEKSACGRIKVETNMEGLILTICIVVDSFVQEKAPAVNLKRHKKSHHPGF